MCQPFLPHLPLPDRSFFLRPGLFPSLTEQEHDIGQHHCGGAGEGGGVEAEHGRDEYGGIRCGQSFGQRPQQQVATHAMSQHHCRAMTFSAPLGGQSFQIGYPGREIVDVAAHRIVRHPARSPLTPPVEACDRPSARRPVMDDLQILLDHVAAPADNHHPAALATPKAIAAYGPAVGCPPIIELPACRPCTPVKRRIDRGRGGGRGKGGRIHVRHGYDLVSHKV